MRILCAVDFSARSEAAARVAAELARRTGGAVELVHVVPPAAGDPQALAMDAGRLDEQLCVQAHERLGALAQRLAKQAGVPVGAHLMEGEVEWSLVARARATDADLIAMGAHGRPAFERFLLGSTAERAVRVADRPVLIVPPGVDALADDLEVLVALDGGAGSDGALGFARALRSSVRCGVTLLRLYWPPEEYRRLGLQGPRELFAPDPAVVADLERAQRLRVGVLPGGGCVTHAVEPAWGDPAASLLEAAREHESNLLVLGAESRHGLGRLAHPRVAARVARQAAGLPVVFVPAPPAARAPASVADLHTVLAATDLSPSGNRAVPLAYALVAAHGGVVELCHVHERALPVPAYAYDRAEGKLTPAERCSLEKDLRALIPPEAQRLGISTRLEIVDGGDAAQAIVQAAERLAADAIVVGSHGKGGLRAALGSVSQAVVHGTRRPVMVVP